LFISIIGRCHNINLSAQQPTGGGWTMAVQAKRK
jgi:hypothetical protein